MSFKSNLSEHNMKFLWILLIIAFICLAAFVVIRHHSGYSSSIENQESPVRRPVHRSFSEDGSFSEGGRIKYPVRIVCLAPNLTEILFALGLGEKIAAVSSDSDYPPEAANKNKVGTFWTPNTEAVIASKPDLVITEWFQQQTAVADSLRQLGYQVLTLKIEKIEELLTAIKQIGTATGCDQQADQLVKNISEQLNDLQLSLRQISKVKVLWVIQPEPLRVAGRDTFINELIELAGGENAIGPTIAQYPEIGTEELLGCGAEVIIQSAMGASNLASQQQAADAFWGRWSSLPAVKNNRIYVVQPDTILRLGPRIPQGIKLIARCLHPEILTINRNTTQ
jgi:iron complex transport system substrate-binding protein